jgi:hypothetical protein
MPPPELAKFHRQLARIDFTRQRMDRLLTDGRIRIRDLDSVYEALFVRAVTGFEAFLEELFIGILSRRINFNPGQVSLRVNINSKSDIETILLQGNDYVQWLPLHNTIRRAEIYLVNGKPFTNLDNSDRSRIQTITYIRNAIAHKSNHAMDQFQKKVIGSLHLLRGEKSPAGFLRTPLRGAAGNRFLTYMSDLGQAAQNLCQEVK